MKTLARYLSLVVVLVLAAAPRAEASFIAYICNDAACTGGGDTIVTDGGAGDGATSINGLISFISVTGGLTFVVNTSQSKPAIGSASSPQMDLNFTATGTGAAWLYASDTDFTGTQPFVAQLNGNSTGGNTNLTAGVFGGTSNTNLDLTSFVLTPSLTTSPFGASLLFGAANTQPYSLTLMLAISRVGSGSTTTGDFGLSAVPEPGSMILLGTGLFGLATAARRRHKNKQNAQLHT